jgi:hypothetical protein
MTSDVDCVKLEGRRSDFSFKIVSSPHVNLKSANPKSHGLTERNLKPNQTIRINSVRTLSISVNFEPLIHLNYISKFSSSITGNTEICGFKFAEPVHRLDYI